MKLGRDLLTVLAFAAVLWFLPDLLRGAYGRASVSYLSLATNALGLMVLALTWDLLARTGQLSLAHAAFYGAGAYTTAILARQDVTALWVGIPLGGLVAVLLAVPLGMVTLRLRGIYFAIATLAFAEVLRAVVRQLPTGIAGGAAGLNVPALFRPAFVPGEMERWEIAFLRNEGYFLAYAALLLFVIVMSLYTRRSRLNHAFTAIRTNEAVAAVMGVRPARTKILAFALSSVGVGTLGALHAHRIGSVVPEAAFAVHTTVFALVTPIFGGLYTTLGPILGAGLLTGLEETLKRTFSEGYLIGYGLVLVLSILYMPRGIVGLVRGLARRVRRPGGPR
ncbi:MAG: branched-chain amino acid ABC transporter permease [Trueperaceae bacterium]|nr:branched-chain amino acid ABC transporter permease [Trueperaceae bacterium]